MSKTLELAAALIFHNWGFLPRLSMVMVSDNNTSVSTAHLTLDKINRCNNINDLCEIVEIVC